MHDRIRHPILKDYLVSWRDIFRHKLNNRNWTLSDIDGFGERNSRFIFIEWKESDGEPLDLTTGQGAALLRLSRLPNVSVMVCWGAVPKGPVTHVQRLGVDDFPVPCYTGEYHYFDLNAASNYFEQWYNWADLEEDGEPWE